MIIDKRLEFSDAQAFTVTAASTSTVDVGVDADLGNGRPLFWVISVDVAADGVDTNETYSFTLQTDDADSFGSATTLATQAIPRGTAAGTKYVQMVPNTNERYLRMYGTLGGTTPSVTVSSWLTDQEVESWKAYNDGI